MIWQGSPTPSDREHSLEAGAGKMANAAPAPGGQGNTAMAFKRRSRSSSGRMAGSLGIACSRTVSLVARFVLSSLTLILIVAGVLYLRLSQGPVELPALGKYLVDQANASNDSVQVGASTVVLDLGDGSVPTGLEFRDVQVTAQEGETLFAVPRLRASFNLTDLVRGDIRPTRISVLSADARFVRGRDGQLRMGLGRSGGVALDVGGDTAEDDENAQIISTIIDGFVGDGELPDELSKLRTVEILDATIQFADRRVGGEVAARHASLRIRRDAGGVTALLDVAGGEGVEPGEIVRLIFDRRRGTGVTSAAGRFGRLDLRKLAGIVPPLEALSGLDTRVEGEVRGRFGPDGRAKRIAGVIVADRGTFTLDGTTYPFDVAALSLDANLENGQVEVTNGLLSTPDIDARLTARAAIERSDTGVLRAASIQADVEGLSIRGGDFFAEDAAFDRGQIFARWSEEAGALQIAESWLARDDFAVRLAGTISSSDRGLAADLRAEAETMSVQDLVHHWPVTVAGNARDWVAKNITRARLDRLVAEFRMRGEDAVLALTAGFEDLDSTYVDGMSPIRNASGELFLDLDGMHLAMAEGTVDPGGAPISLGGSWIEISDFNGAVTPADIRLKAAGPMASVLQLIDQEPLYLVRTLGLDLDGVRGASDVTARLEFPLIADLKVEDVDVDAKAVVSGVDMALAVGEARNFRVRSDRLEVAADVRRMQLSGDVVIDGSPARVDWREDYSHEAWAAPDPVVGNDDAGADATARRPRGRLWRQRANSSRSQPAGLGGSAVFAGSQPGRRVAGDRGPRLGQGAGHARHAPCRRHAGADTHH